MVFVRELLPKVWRLVNRQHSAGRLSGPMPHTSRQLQCLTSDALNCDQAAVTGTFTPCVPWTKLHLSAISVTDETVDCHMIMDLLCLAGLRGGNIPTYNIHGRDHASWSISDSWPRDTPVLQISSTLYLMMLMYDTVRRFVGNTTSDWTNSWLTPVKWWIDDHAVFPESLTYYRISFPVSEVRKYSGVRKI